LSIEGSGFSVSRSGFRVLDFGFGGYLVDGRHSPISSWEACESPTTAPFKSRQERATIVDLITIVDSTTVVDLITMVDLTGYVLFVDCHETGARMGSG